ncbi:hypothetical protein [Neisseria sp. 83E34]|uniref:hypothetical protein n=1 Tax=Neisseria sp. 83E34 TaxID=1692264 RepID=UPI0006CE6E62|nr:hypothetical protein [Neisseria sp. 83E34]KPN71130.1 hypothetical protein AKG09_08195 [Neisseria sp. 83E34]
MIKHQIRNIALFSTASSIMLAPVLLMVAGTAYLNQMLAVNCILAAVLSALLVQSAQVRAITGLILFGIALSLLMPAMPFIYVLAGSAAGGFLTWSAPFLFRQEEETVG